MVVPDADSPDGTADIARAWGAEVYSETPKLLPRLRPGPGQGATPKTAAVCPCARA